MLSTINAQLIHKLDVIPEYLVAVYNSNNGGRPSRSTLLAVFRILSGNFERIYIVLDALDEVSYSEQTDILGVMRRLITDVPMNNSNVIIASRREPHLVNRLSSLPFQEIDLGNWGVDRDIQDYISGTLIQDPRFNRWPTVLQTEVKTALAINARGMYVAPSSSITNPHLRI